MNGLDSHNKTNDLSKLFLRLRNIILVWTKFTFDLFTLLSILQMRLSKATYYYNRASFVKQLKVNDLAQELNSGNFVVAGLDPVTF